MYFGTLSIDTSCACKRSPPFPVYDPRHGEFYCANCQRPLNTVIIQKKSTLLGGGCDDGASFKRYYEQIDEYKELINEYSQRISELESQLSDYKDTVIKKDDEIKELLQSNEALKIEINNQKGFLHRSRSESNGDVKKLSQKLIGTEKELEKLQSSYDSICRDKEDIIAILDDKRREISKLTKNQQQLLNSLSKAEREAKSWKSDYLQLRDTLANNEMSLEDAYSTNKHLRNELEAYTKIDARSITEMFLTYWTRVFNASSNKTSLEDLQEFIVNMNEMLKMNAVGLGLHIKQHEVGSELSSNKLNIQSVTTTDKDLDGTVKSSDCFGCSFDSDHLAEIPESLSVYTFNETRLMVRNSESRYLIKIEDPSGVSLASDQITSVE
jgi:predicted  nucleic acid-binding Zn-ribbon protein